MIFRQIFPAFALALASCATPPVGGSAGTVVAGAGELPAPTRMDLSAAARPYLIGPFDKLRIDVFGVQDLQRDVQIDASGRLSFPLIGTIEAAGKTPEELADAIESGLRDRFIRDPQVTVNLLETVSQVITVDGQVERPGLYPVVGRMTLMRAVATAGGAGEYAKLDDVLIFREVDGQKMLGVYNLKGIRRGNYPDPEVYANDVVVVGDSAARRLFKDILQAAPLLTTPLIILLRK